MTGYIYKLCILDGTLEDCYVGSTMNKYNRKCAHKLNCNDKNSPAYNYNVYQFIRNNGGFENWDLVVLEELKTPTKFELTTKERQWIEKIKPSLNCNKPPKTPTICEHGIQGSSCKKCNGTSICEHQKLKRRCVLCKGSSTCEHNRIKHQCIDCKGTSICVHNKNKHSCKICKGSKICEHNVNKQYCKVCKGGSICEHNKVRRRCVDCGGNAVKIVICSFCNSSVKSEGLKKHQKTDKCKLFQ